MYKRQENIVLKSNTGKNTFSFIWKSESHKPILTDGNTVINIVDKNNINKIDYIFNPIYVYDSYKPTDTSIENLDKYKHFNENNYYEVNQIDDETYVITIVVDKGFLTDPRTVYPVVIDLSLIHISCLFFSAFRRVKAGWQKFFSRKRRFPLRLPVWIAILHPKEAAP